MAEPHCIWDGSAQLGEGVLWHEQEQAVYWVDIIASTLYRLNADNSIEDWHFPGSISAVVPCISGGLIATFQNGLSHLDLASATASHLLDLETELPNNRFNDGCCDTRGQFWFGSMDNNESDSSGRFYRMDTQGDITEQPAFGKVCISNGPAASTDGKWLYFTDTIAKKIYRTALDSEGDAQQAEVHITLDEGCGYPDGMCTDTEGGLWVCHFFGNRITRFLPNGKVDRVIEMPVPNITKCALGGPKLSTLYITTAAKSLDTQQLQQYPQSGGLFAIEVPFQGSATLPISQPSGTVSSR
ncbi:MAG: D-xylonolactonase [Halioglobus sp.]|jgi:D-xylonolactonase